MPLASQFGRPCTHTYYFYVYTYVCGGRDCLDNLRLYRSSSYSFNYSDGEGECSVVVGGIGGGGVGGGVMGSVTVGWVAKDVLTYPE